MAISYIGQGQSGSATVTLPSSIQYGDIIILAGYRNATTAPSNPAGFTGIYTLSANSNSQRLTYKFADGTESSTNVTMTNANVTRATVYRGVGRVGATSFVTAATNTTHTIASLILEVTDGTSWVVTTFGSRQTTSTSTPGTSTLRGTVQTGTTSSAILVDSNAGVSSWASANVTIGATATMASGAVELVESNPITTFYDPFNQTSLNSAKWFSTSAASATFTYGSTGAQVNLPSTTTASSSGKIYSKKTYNLTGGEASLNILSTYSSGIASADSVLYLGLSTALGNSSFLRWVIEAGTLYAQYNNGAGNTTPYSVAYNGTTHAWLRIRESSGTIYWDSSVDGVTWTNRGSVSTATFTPGIIALQVGIWGYTYGAETGVTGVYKWANFNGVYTPATSTQGMMQMFVGM